MVADLNKLTFYDGLVYRLVLPEEHIQVGDRFRASNTGDIITIDRTDVDYGSLPTYRAIDPANMSKDDFASLRMESEQMAALLLEDPDATQDSDYRLRINHVYGAMENYLSQPRSGMSAAEMSQARAELAGWVVSMDSGRIGPIIFPLETVDIQDSDHEAPSATEFARTHSTDADWVALLEKTGRKPVVLKAGQEGTYSGFPATVTEHYHNGMYNVRVPGGPICIDGSAFKLPKKEKHMHVHINTGGDAFSGENKQYEVARILESAADRIEGGETQFTLRDVNGNNVGIVDSSKDPGDLQAPDKDAAVIGFRTGNAAFADHAEGWESARIVRVAAERIREGETTFKLRDLNGNVVGDASEHTAAVANESPPPRATASEPGPSL